MSRYVFAAACMVLLSCGTEQPTETVLYDDVNDVSLIVEHFDGPPLSQSEDRVSVVENGDRTVVFEGYGGSPVSLRSLRKGVLLIAYCGGSIRNTVSFLVHDSSSGNAIAVKVQPVVTPGIQVDGKVVCGLR